MRATIRLTGCGGVSKKWRFAPCASPRRRGVVKKAQCAGEFRGKEGFTVCVARCSCGFVRDRRIKPAMLYCVFAGGAAFSAFAAGVLCTVPPPLFAVSIGTWFTL